MLLQTIARLDDDERGPSIQNGLELEFGKFYSYQVGSMYDLLSELVRERLVKRYRKNWSKYVFFYQLTPEGEDALLQARSPGDVDSKEKKRRGLS